MPTSCKVKEFCAILVECKVGGIRKIGLLNFRRSVDVIGAGKAKLDDMVLVVVAQMLPINIKCLGAIIIKLKNAKLLASPRAVRL